MRPTCGSSPERRQPLRLAPISSWRPPLLCAASWWSGPGEGGPPVTEAANEGIDTIETDLTYVLPANVERLLLTGSGAIKGTGNALSNTLIGNTKSNVLDGRAGVDTMAGGAGNDTYVVDAAADVVSEAVNAGTDTIESGVSYALPARYPTLGQSDRVELLGSEGTMIIDDDHMDHLLFSEKGIPHAYVPDHAVNMAFLGSNTAGDWAVGDFWGPLGNETRTWLDSLVTGNPTVQTTPEQARLNLETTLAIERAVATGQPVRLPLQE